MVVKFILTAVCRINDIDKKAGSDTEVAKELEELLKDNGIMAMVNISKLTYINEGRMKNETGSTRDKHQGIDTELDQ